MAKKLRILWTLFRCRVSRNMMYRLSFWTAFWVDLMVFLIQLAAFSVIFGQVESIGGWTLPHMVIFVGTFTMLDSLYMCTYFFGVLAIPDKIRNGSLDLYLTRPVNTLFMLSVEHMDFGSILLTVPGMLMIGWGLGQLGIRLTLGLLAGFVLLFGMMFILMYCLMVLLRTPAFWLVRANAFNELENTFVDFSYRIPGIAFQGVWKVLLYLVLPYGLMATLPTQFLTGGMHWYHWLLVSGVLAGFWIMTQIFWRAGLRRYGSASS